MNPLIVAVVISLFAASIGAGIAQTYPSKPIKLIVPADAGSPPDIRARWLSEKLRPLLGQPVIVENRGGAAGRIGTEAAAKSAPDGYTLVMVHQGTLALNPHLHARLGYDPVKDLAPVASLVVSALVLAVHPSVPANSVAGLVRLAKEKPGQLNWGSGLVGSPPHMAGELFRRLARIEVANIPYKSVRQAEIDLIAGRLSYTIDGISMMLPEVKAGRVRALAVTSPKRVATLPDIPTIAESGVPGYEYMPWSGVCAPAGTPREIIAQLNAEIAKILKTQEARDWFAAQGSEPLIQSPEEFAGLIRTEYAKWGSIIREAGIKAE
ncbi:MAG: Bug family tripartite tricarboxylate transporter substrate binding protein [Burkholderiales bacterium]